MYMFFESLLYKTLMKYWRFYVTKNGKKFKQTVHFLGFNSAAISKVKVNLSQKQE